MNQGASPRPGLQLAKPSVCLIAFGDRSNPYEILSSQTSIGSYGNVLSRRVPSELRPLLGRRRPRTVSGNESLVPGRSREAARKVLIRAGLVVCISFGMVTVSGFPSVFGTASASPLIQMGDYVTFHCPNGKVSWEGAVVCHDGSATRDVCEGTCSFELVATMDAGNSFASWTSSGDACLGSYPNCEGKSYSNPSQAWAFCPFGEVCSGNYYLNHPGGGGGENCGGQVITVRIPDGLGTVFVNGTGYSNGQSFCQKDGSIASLVGVTNLPNWFWRWVTDDGSLGTPLSPGTDFSIGYNTNDIGNISMVGTPRDNFTRWAGFTGWGTDVTHVAGSFTIPTLNPANFIHFSSQLEGVALWVGIGAGEGTDASLWQAGFHVNYSEDGANESVCAWYEAYPSPPYSPPGGFCAGPHATVYISVTSINGTDTFSIGRCGEFGSTGCWWNGSVVNFYPDQGTGEWIAEPYCDSAYNCVPFPEFSTDLEFGDPTFSSSHFRSDSFVMPMNVSNSTFCFGKCEDGPPSETLAPYSITTSIADVRWYYLS